MRSKLFDQVKAIKVGRAIAQALGVTVAKKEPKAKKVKKVKTEEEDRIVIRGSPGGRFSNVLVVGPVVKKRKSAVGSAADAKSGETKKKMKKTQKV